MPRVLMLGTRRIEDAVLSIYRGFQRMGVDVRHMGTRKPNTKYDPLDDIEPKLHAVIHEWRPDVLLWVMCKTDCPEGLIAGVREKFPKLKTVFHSFDDPAEIDRSGSPWCREFEYAITCAESSIAWYEEHGIRAICLYPPCDADIHGNAQPNPAEVCDFSLAATSTYPPELYPAVLGRRTELARAAARTGTFNLYGRWVGARVAWGEQYGALDLEPHFRGRRSWDQMPSIYAATKITLNSHNRPDARGYLNERAIHAPACGSFMLCDRVVGIERLFEPGKHFDTWSTNEEAADKMAYWLRNEDRRKAVAYAGKQHALKEYSNVRHNEKLLKFIELDVATN